MSALIDFFIGFGNVIKSVFTFLIDTVMDLIYVIGLLGSFVLKIPQMIGWLPASCVSLIVIIFSVVLIYKILGREG